MNESPTARDGVDVDVLLRTVVAPVVDEILRPDEIESMDLAWRPVRYPAHPDAPARGEAYRSTFTIGEPEWVTEEWLVLRIVAVGEQFSHQVIEAGAPLRHVDPVWIAEQLYSELQDFVAESRFGWGQLRGRR